MVSINHSFDIYVGKVVLLDKLLPKLKERDSRVLIFSQVIIYHYLADLNGIMIANCILGKNHHPIKAH